MYSIENEQIPAILSQSPRTNIGRIPFASRGWLFGDARSIFFTFGSRRSYNNGSTLYHGLDFSVVLMSLILRACTRKVINRPDEHSRQYAFIDHGQGVVSGYRLCRIQSQYRRLVGTRKLIGLNCKTGRVTAAPALDIFH